MSKHHLYIAIAITITFLNVVVLFGFFGNDPAEAFTAKGPGDQLTSGDWNNLKSDFIPVHSTMIDGHNVRVIDDDRKLRLDAGSKSAEIQLANSKTANHWAMYAEDSTGDFHVWGGNNGKNLLSIGLNNDVIVEDGTFSIRQDGYDGTDLAKNKSFDINHNGSQLTFRMGGNNGRLPIVFSQQGISNFTIDEDSHIKINSGNTYPASFMGTGGSAIAVVGGIQYGQYARLTFGNGTEGNYGGLGLRVEGGGSYLYLGTSNNYANGITNEALVIDPSGKIGIGTTVPGAALDVTSAGTTFVINRTGAPGAQPDIILKSNGTTQAVMSGFSEPGGGGVRFYTADSSGATPERIRIDSSGNIGIDKSNPGEKLDVNGNIKASGTICAGSNCLTSTVSSGTWCGLYMENRGTGNTNYLNGATSDSIILCQGLNPNVSCPVGYAKFSTEPRALSLDTVQDKWVTCIKQ